MYLLGTPQEIATKIFTELPQDLRRMQQTKSGSRLLNVLEGPSFDIAGNFYCVDIHCGRIYQISPAGRWDVVAEYDGMPNGLKIHKDGRIFVADRKNGIVVVDPNSGAVEHLVAGPGEGRRFLGLNDLVFDRHGNLYFTDQGRSGLQNPHGVVYCLKSDGALETVVGGIPSPNGIVFNMRESELFIAVTRASAVWRTELEDPARRTGLYVQLPSAGPDGLALDQDGNVAIAHPGAGNVILYSKWGEPLHIMRSGRGNLTTNIAYGGADGRTLFIVESKTCSILTARMPVAGKSMYSHA